MTRKRATPPIRKRGFLDGYDTYDTSKGFGNADKWQEAFRQRMTGEEAERILKEEHSEDEEKILFKRRVSVWDINTRTECACRILGVKEDDSPEHVKKTYYKLMKEWYEDRHPDNREYAKKMSQKIIAAYTILTD